MKTIAKPTAEARKDLYEMVTEAMISALEAGVVPWRRPWRDLNGAGSAANPMNRLTGKRYRGVNVFMLDCAAMVNNFSTSEWVTFRQALELGGNVKKGAKSSRVVFWKIYEKTDANGKEKRLPCLQQYCVFNLDQCEGIAPRVKPIQPEELPDLPPETQATSQAQSILAAYIARSGIEFTEGRGNRAYYRPAFDAIHMPDRKAFDNLDEFFGTFCHECAHSTGHENRLKRELAGVFSSESYGKEELIAEMTAAFFCRFVGLNQTVEQGSAAYIGGWLKTLKAPGNKRMVMCAAASAQKAFELILGDVQADEADADSPA